MIEGDSVPLSTANGVVSSKDYTIVFLTWLQQSCKTLILQNSPDVLSLGRLIDEFRLRFV